MCYRTGITKPEHDLGIEALYILKKEKDIFDIQERMSSDRLTLVRSRMEDLKSAWHSIQESHAIARCLQKAGLDFKPEIKEVYDKFAIYHERKKELKEALSDAAGEKFKDKLEIVLRKKLQKALSEDFI